MATRPAYVWTGSDWDDIGDKRLGASVTALNTALGSKLDVAGGKILQIVRATDSTTRSTTSTSFVDASIDVTITPHKNDSAVLLLWTGNFITGGDLAGDTRAEIRITDNSDNLIAGDYKFGTRTGPSGVNFILDGTFTVIGRATPAITSPVTFKGRFRHLSGNTVFLQNAVATGQMYAIEVSA
jgi:hypothetical protein